MVAKLQDPANRPLLIVVSISVLLVLCCCAAALAGAVVYLASGSGGTCVVDSPTDRPDWAHCYDGWTETECNELSDSTYSSSGSCNALGFTKHCPGEGSTWRMPEYPCD